MNSANPIPSYQPVLRYELKKKTYNKTEVSKKDFDVFDKRLGLSTAQSLGQSEAKNKVASFMTTHQGNINWYTKAIGYETNWKNGYRLITVLLVLFLPVTLFCLTDFISYVSPELADDKGAEYYSSYSLAVLTGIFGFHRIMNVWLAKRKLLSIFHEASAGLKANLYAFEDRWNNGGIYKSGSTTEVTTEFDTDLEKSITTGRSIANQERKKYYEYIENPEVDLGNIFTSAFASASSMMTNFRSKRLERELLVLEKDRDDARQREDLENEVSALKKQFESLKYLKAVTQANISVSNPVPASLTDMLAEIEAKMNSIQITLTQKESKL
ncbi:MAG: hypothetical protein Roseis2KO_44760 [Roseivirga sp.]